MIPALILFIITYGLMLALPKYRAYIAFTSAVIFVLLGYIPLGGILPAIDWNVIFMIAGTMGIVTLFIDSKMPPCLLT